MSPRRPARRIEKSDDRGGINTTYEAKKVYAASYDFGHDEILRSAQPGATTPLDEMLKRAAPLDAIGAKLVTHYAFDLRFGIGPYRESEVTYGELAKRVRGMDALTVPVEERIVEDNRIRYLMEEFLDNGVGKLFSLSWTEFVSLPRHEVDMMLEVAGQRRKRHQPLE